MKVILQKDVPNLGDAGEIKSVADGYARNYLIPKKMVVPAIGNSTKAVEHQKRLMQIRTEKRLAEMKDVSSKLEALGSVEIVARVGARNKLFGSVTAMNISQALAENGFNIEKRKVDLPDTIKTLGTFPVKIRLAEKLIVNLNVNVVADAESQEQVEKEEAAIKAAEDRAREAEARASGETVAEEEPAAEVEEAGETQEES